MAKTEDTDNLEIMPISEMTVEQLMQRFNLSRESAEKAKAIYEGGYKDVVYINSEEETRGQ